MLLNYVSCSMLTLTWNYYPLRSCRHSKSSILHQWVFQTFSKLNLNDMICSTHVFNAINSLPNVLDSRFACLFLYHIIGVAVNEYNIPCMRSSCPLIWCMGCIDKCSNLYWSSSCFWRISRKFLLATSIFIAELFCSATCKWRWIYYCRTWIEIQR